MASHPRRRASDAQRRIEDRPLGPGKIWIWAQGEEPDIEGLAMAEDGAVVAGHISSSMYWFRIDMGLTSTNKHDRYKAHYPLGYELIEGRPPNYVLARNKQGAENEQR